MLVRCSFCGKQKIVDNEFFSSPIFRCDVCKKLFYDEKIKEPALNPPPVNEREKLSFFIYLGVLFGLGFTIFGLSGVFIDGSDYLVFLIFGLLWTIGSILLIWSTYRDKKKREEHYQKLLKESHKRLSNFSYQEQLIVASNGNNEIVSLLKKYNSSHRLDFVIDVDSILHNYELENIADDNNNKIEEKITEVADVVEEVSINEKQETKKEIKLFCRKCGTELLLDSDFCHRCGEKVEIK